MITYVINTSENKTFDRERGSGANKCFDASLLFELAGYKEIRWMYCRLDEVETCAQRIVVEQNKLTYEDFRVAVIVDFYNFDRVRVPFSRDNQGDKVDVELYKPFLEAYLVKNLFDPIINSGYPIANCEVYYIQRRESGGVMNPANQKEQEVRIFDDVPEEYLPKEEEVDTEIRDEDLDAFLGDEEDDDGFLDEFGEDLDDDELDDVELELDEALPENKEGKAQEMTMAKLAAIIKWLAKHPPVTDGHSPLERANTEQEILKAKAKLKKEAIKRKKCLRALKKGRRSYYHLHIQGDAKSGGMFLTFKSNEYHGGKANFDEFLQGVRTVTLGFNSTLTRRHYYTTAGGSVNAAYDNIALSLYLVSAYEGKGGNRGEETLTDEEIDASVKKMDRQNLGDLLLESYKRVVAAKMKAISTHAQYYTLDSFKYVKRKRKWLEEDPPEDVLQDVAGSLSVEDQYETILDLADHKGGENSPEAVEEIGKLMHDFLKERDENSMESKQDEFDANGFVKQKALIDFPRDSEYDELIKDRREKLQKNLASALAAEYVAVDFTNEKEKAEVAYEKYVAAKSDMKMHVAGDLFMAFFAIIAMIIPYAALQCYKNPFGVVSIILYGIAAAIFVGVVVLSFALHLLPILSRKQLAEQTMRDAYNEAIHKKEASFAKLKARYQNELPEIEALRYEIRLIEQLRQENILINKNLDVHKVMLEQVEVCLKTMMNNLNIYIKGDVSTVEVVGFDPDKPIMANDVYKVFKLEAIDSLFRKKGGF